MMTKTTNKQTKQKELLSFDKLQPLQIFPDVVCYLESCNSQDGCDIIWF